jgi:hypothetical protein
VYELDVFRTKPLQWQAMLSGSGQRPRPAVQGVVTGRTCWIVFAVHTHKGVRWTQSVRYPPTDVDDRTGDP